MDDGIVIFVLSPGLARMFGIAAIGANQGNMAAPIGNNETVRSVLSVIFK